MKNTLLSFSLFAAALSATISAPLAASTSSSAPIAYQVTAAGPYVESGSARVTVVAKLGQPTQRLSDNVWVYRGYRATNNAPVSPDCRTLVVTFADDCVTDLRLVNDAAERTIAANVKTGAARGYARSE